MPCRALHGGLGESQPGQRQAAQRSKARCRGARDPNSAESESPSAPDSASSPPGGLSPFLCERHTAPCPPTSSRGRCASRGDGHETGLQSGRPSADVRVIIIIPLPQMARSGLPPPLPARPPFRGPQGLKGPAGPWLPPGPPAPAQRGPASSSQGLSSGTRTQVAVSGWLLGRAPRVGGGGGAGVALCSRGTKAGWELAGRHQGSMHNGPGAGGFAPGRHLHNVWGRNRCPVNRQL